MLHFTICSDCEHACPGLLKRPRCHADLLCPHPSCPARRWVMIRLSEIILSIAAAQEPLTCSCAWVFHSACSCVTFSAVPHNLLSTHPMRSCAGTIMTLCQLQIRFCCTAPDVDVAGHGCQTEAACCQLALAASQQHLLVQRLHSLCSVCCVVI